MNAASTGFFAAALEGDPEANNGADGDHDEGDGLKIPNVGEEIIEAVVGGEGAGDRFGKEAGGQGEDAAGDGDKEGAAAGDAGTEADEGPGDDHPVETLVDEPMGEEMADDAADDRAE
jgi:hypothetical protein